MATSVSGIAQRTHAGFEWSVTGSSPIVGAVCCSVGASSAGSAAPPGSDVQHGFGIEMEEAGVVA